MGHIFISYSHKDKGYVHKLQEALQKEGFEVWVDDRIDLGKTWPHVIQEQLDTCSAFIVVMTENAYNSEWVQNEVTRAQRKKKPFFALLLKGDTWLSVEAKQYEDVTGGKLPSAKFYDSLALGAERKEITPNGSGLKEMESRAIQCELKGDFWCALKTWYQIKQIDPLYPRVDVKIKELEREIPRTKVPSEFDATLKPILDRARPFFRMAGIIVIIGILIGGSILAVHWLLPFITTASPTVTITFTPTHTRHPTATRTLLPTSTVTQTPKWTATVTLTSTPTRTPTNTATHTLTSTPTYTSTPLPTISADIKSRRSDYPLGVPITFLSEQSTVTNPDGTKTFCYRAGTCTYEWRLRSATGSVVDLSQNAIYIFTFDTPGPYSLHLKVCYQETDSCDTDILYFEVER